MDQSTSLKLAVTGVVLSVISLLANANCPTQVCECEQDINTQRVDIVCTPLPGNILQEVPTFTPSPFPYSKLIMAGHNISVIRNNAFAGINFEELDLSENPITRIDDYAFNGTVGDITSIILHSKKIPTFPTMAINILTELQSLTLKNFDIPTLPGDPFLLLSKLKSVTLDTCSVRSLDQNVFKNQVDSLTDLNLHGNDFPSVPSVITSLNRLNSFTFSQQNGLTEIVDNSFQDVKSLKRLDISQNGLTKIHSNAFNGLNTLLETLISDHCSLTDESLVSLKQLQKLKGLKLDYNMIRNIAADLFDNMSQLETLRLVSNKLTSINKEMFQGFGNSLRELHLEDNEISNIDQGTFTAFTNLRGLYLDNQPGVASQLDGNAFNSQQNTLQFLSLKNTSFSTPKLASLSNLVELETLDLSNNNVESIPNFTFRLNIKLNFMDLSSNTLTQLTQAQLFGLENSLQNLRLSSNSITSLEECTLYKFDINIYDINLDSNPLSCDCHLRWLKQKHLNEQDDFSDLFMNWKCSTPAALSQTLFDSADINEFVCETTSTPTTTNCEEIYWQFTTTVSTSTSTVSTPTGGVSSLSPSTPGNNSTGKSTSPSSATSDNQIDPTDTTGSSTTYILVGAIVGSLVVLAIVAVVIWVVCRRKRAEKTISSGTFVNGMPRTSYDSRRFTRPPPSATELENDRNTVCDDQGADRGSAWGGRGANGVNVSTISSGTTPRYVPDPTAPSLPPLPPGAHSHPYPAYGKEGRAQYHDNSAFTQEPYDEIPADRMDGYARVDPNRQGHENEAFDYHREGDKYQMYHTYNMPDSPGHVYNMPDSPGHTYNMPDSPGHTYNMPDSPGYDSSSREAPIDNTNQVPDESNDLEASIPPPSVMVNNRGGNINLAYNTDNEVIDDNVQPYSVRDVVKHIPREPQEKHIPQEPKGRENPAYEPEGPENPVYDKSGEQYLHTQGYGTPV